ncbi:MAG: hypothetical protein WCD18_12895, partial [Thermosynechococcaceae cyanobacterium]
SQVAKQESLTVDSNMLEQQVKMTLEQMKDQKLDRDQLREILAAELLQDNAIQWLKAHAAVTLVHETTRPALSPEETATLETGRY